MARALFVSLQGFTDEQQSQLKENSTIVKERETEITKIVEVKYIDSMCSDN